METRTMNPVHIVDEWILSLFYHNCVVHQLGLLGKFWIALVKSAVVWLWAVPKMLPRKYVLCGVDLVEKIFGNAFVLYDCAVKLCGSRTSYEINGWTCVIWAMGVSFESCAIGWSGTCNACAFNGWLTDCKFCNDCGDARGFVLSDLNALSPTAVFVKRFEFGLDESIEFKPNRLWIRFVRSHTVPLTNVFNGAE